MLLGGASAASAGAVVMSSPLNASERICPPDARTSTPRRDSIGRAGASAAAAAAAALPFFLLPAAAASVKRNRDGRFLAFAACWTTAIPPSSSSSPSSLGSRISRASARARLARRKLL